jgi:hypothetical protein
MTNSRNIDKNTTIDYKTISIQPSRSVYMNRASDAAVKDYIATANLEELRSLTNAISKRILGLPPKGKYDEELKPSNEQKGEENESCK